MKLKLFSRSLTSADRVAFSGVHDDVAGKSRAQRLLRINSAKPMMIAPNTIADFILTLSKSSRLNAFDEALAIVDADHPGHEELVNVVGNPFDASVDMGRIHAAIMRAARSGGGA